MVVALTFSRDQGEGEQRDSPTGETSTQFSRSVTNLIRLGVGKEMKPVATLILYIHHRKPSSINFLPVVSPD
jgi:hypothetical protein